MATDLGPQILSIVQTINSRVSNISDTVSKAVQAGIDQTENRIIESIHHTNGMILLEIANSESHLNNSLTVIADKINTVNQNLQSLDDYIHNQILPTLAHIEIVTENIEGIALELAEKIDALPGEVAKEVAKIFGDDFKRIADTFEDFIVLYEELVSEQTEKIKASIDLGMNRLKSSIEDQTASLTVQLNTLRAGLIQSIDDGNTATVKVLGTITSTLDAKLTALTESQADMSNTVILFLSEFWTNAKTFWSEMNGVSLSMVQKTMELGEELNSQVVRNIKSGETPVVTDDRAVLAFLASETPYG